MRGARVVRLIETTIATRGAGVPGDPVRQITQYWTLEGKFLFEIDPCEVLADQPVKAGGTD